MVDGTYAADDKDTWSYVMVGDPGWRDYAVEVDVTAKAIHSGDAIAILLRSKGPNDGMRFDIDGFNSKWVLYKEGQSTDLSESQGQLAYTHGQWYTTNLRVEAKGDMYSAYLNGERIMRIQDNSLASGQVGLATAYSSNEIRFDNFIVEPVP
jgi:hypothetical protein